VAIPDAEAVRPLGWRLALRAVIGVLVAGLLLWLVFPITFAGVRRGQQPDRALEVAPADARALAQSAQRLIGEYARRRRPGLLERARAQAQAALARDPTVVSAATALGLTLALQGNANGAERAFRYAAFLSRRDIGAQLWLLERAVQRNNIRSALVHYDTILRTSPAMGPTLMPVMASASASPPIAAELNRLLRTRPAWKPDFVSVLLTGQSDPAALYTVTRGLLGTTEPREREQLALLLKNLTQAEAFDLSWRAYVEAWPNRARGGAPVWNGDFTGDSGFAPFDWGFAEDPALAAERRARGNGNPALFLPTGSTADGEAARQLLRLAPGAYVLSGEAGGVAEDPATRPQLVLACARAPHAGLASADLPVSPASGRAFRLGFTVPAGCAYQWISLRVRGDFDHQMANPAWVDSIRIGRP
jgi:hypothetical protein